MPVFSCGGMRYQYKWQDLPQADIPATNQANLEATIRRAIELGINHVETARGYGSSERQLGQILPHLERDSFILQTKIAPEDDPERFEANFHDSIERLGVDHVDLLALHGINNRELLDWSLRDGGCFEVAQRLREQGKARFIGFSTHAQLDVILEAIRFGEARTGQGFDYVNLHWYYIMQRNWQAIEAATERDMGVFIISPTDKGGRLYAPPDKLRSLCEPLSPIVFNDLFCLSQPQVHTLSVGAARPTDFDEHLLTLPLLTEAERVLDPICRRLERAMQEATGDPHPEDFLPGLPPWQSLPNQHNVEIILWLLNLARGWDMGAYAQWRFSLLSNADHWFAGNRPRGPQDVDEAALLKALGDYPRRAEVPEKLRQAAALFGSGDQRRLSQS